MTNQNKENNTVRLAAIIITAFVGAIAASMIGDSSKQDKILETINRIDKSSAVIQAEMKYMRRDLDKIKEDNQKQDDLIREMREADREN
jgi:hypothetical protein